MTVELRRLLWGILAGALVVGALAGLLAVATREGFGERQIRILATAWAALLCGSALLAGLRLIERGTLPVFGIVLAVAAPLGFVLFAIPIWDEDRQTERWGRIVISDFFLIISGLIFASARLAVWATHRAVAAVVLGVGFALTLTTATGLYDICTFSTSGEGSNDALRDWGGRSLVALFLLAVFFYLLAPTLERLIATSAPRESASADS